MRYLEKTKKSLADAAIEFREHINMRTSNVQAVFRAEDVIYAILYYVNNEPDICSIGLSYDSTNTEYRDRVVQYYNIKNVNIDSEYHTPILNVQFNLSKEHDDFAKERFSNQLQLDNIAKKCHFLATSWVKQCSNMKERSLKVLLYQITRNGSNQVPKYDTSFCLPLTYDCVNSAREYLNKYENNEHNVSNTYAPSLNHNNLDGHASMHLMPLVKRSINKIDISSRQWLNFIAMQVVDIMHITNICPSFPRFGGYMIISNNTPLIFDNMTPIFDISVKLTTDMINITHSIQDCTASIPINYFDNIINVSRVFANEFILLSNYAMAVFTEYNGPVIGDIEELQIPQITKLVFEYLYALHVLHVSGIVHGDVFINNLTIKPANKSYSYSINNKIYKFADTNKSIGGIIDFNNVIINKNSAIYQAHQPTTPADVGHFRYVFEHRALTMLNRLHNESIVKISEKIATADIDQLDSIFWILASIDVFDMISSLYELTTLSYSARKWLKQLRENVRQTVATQLSAAELPSPTHVAANLIDTYFADYVVKSNDPADFIISDITRYVKKIKLPFI
jgi:hypothetical protein